MFFSIYFILPTSSHLLPTNRWALVFSFYLSFIHKLLLEILPEGQKFFSLLFSLFSCIALFNLIALIPYSYAASALPIVSLFFSFSIWFGALFTALVYLKTLFFSSFLPLGAPILLSPAFLLIEILSYSARAASLGLRLSINLSASHMLVSILASFSQTNPVLPLFILFALFFLEAAIAVIQAYVFSLLTLVYLGEGLKSH